MATSLLRLPAVMAQCGLSRSSVYARAKKGLFPKPVALTAHARGWVDFEVQAVIAARIAGQSDEQVRALVASLEQRRTIAAAA